ncbi:MAG: glycyl-tRNA synthetase beta chain [Gaiellaceae bacterium]|nr:glycyl-tRNA synthetase beta chain [Gaiellaceae bacterium]
MTASLLIELGCEELPAAACRVADADAATVLQRLLTERRLAPATVETYVSPRRIAVLAHGVPARQAAERVEHRGPPEKVARNDDGWTKAGEGFARRHGLEADDLEMRDGFVWAGVDAATATLAALAQELVDGLVEGLQMPKNMRWAGEALRFARPIRTLTVLHGTDVLDAQVAGVRSERQVRGHRLVAPTFELAAADAYVSSLAAAGVTVPSALRHQQITAALDAAAAAAGAAWSDPAGVLAEVQHLVERVHVVTGSFHERYLELPDRVLVTAMQSHQRYLPLAADGRRFPGFLTVVNSDPEHDDIVRAGNERVLVGRLDDAVFSVGQDRQRGLEALAADLERITFHARAGSVADKTERIVALVRALGGDERALAAARLAKADQASTLVQEFAELEGYVGEQYARAEGLDEEVARAIGEQFLPDAAGGELPQTTAGALLAVADKLDTLATTLAIGERPTGSRDPYGLRRAAAGIVAIALDRRLDLRLAERVGQIHAMLSSQGAQLTLDAPATVEAVEQFVLDRVDAVLAAEGVPIDLARAARGAGAPADPVGYADRAHRLQEAVGGEQFARALNAFTRCHRLAAKGIDEAAEAVDPALFEHDSEVALAAAIAAAADEPGALAAAASLSEPVDAFFDAVLVMSDDVAVRANRLRLLVDVTRICQRVGDLSQVQR